MTCWFHLEQRPLRPIPFGMSVQLIIVQSIIVDWTLPSRRKHELSESTQPCRASAIILGRALLLTFSAALRTSEFSPSSEIDLRNASTSFGRHFPSKGLPPSVPYEPILRSSDTARLTTLESVPSFLQML